MLSTVVMGVPRANEAAEGLLQRSVGLSVCLSVVCLLWRDYAQMRQREFASATQNSGV